MGFGYHTNAHRYCKSIYSKLFTPYLLEMEEIRNAGTRKSEEGDRSIYVFFIAMTSRIFVLCLNELSIPVFISISHP